MSFGEALLSVLLPLALVVGVLVIVLMLIRRHGRLAAGAALLKVEQILPVGPRERVVVLSDGRRRFAIGVTAHSITALTEVQSADESAGSAVHHMHGEHPHP